MKFQYLGTAAAEGIPALFCQCNVCNEARRRGGKDLRLRTGALIDDKILLDFSPDLYASHLKFGIQFGEIRNILITHTHIDHFASSQLLLYTDGFAHLKKRSKLYIWGSGESEQFYKKTEETYPELGNDICFQVLKPFKTMTVEGIEVTALPAQHDCPGSFIYILQNGGSKVLYGNDSGPFFEDTWSYLEKQNATPFTLVSFDSTHGILPGVRKGHMTFQDNINARNRMLYLGVANSKTKFVCQHFSHNGMLLHNDIEKMMSPEGFETAFDGKTLYV